jgi:hypothetical protein
MDLVILLETALNIRTPFQVMARTPEMVWLAVRWTTNKYLAALRPSEDVE